MQKNHINYSHILKLFLIFITTFLFFHCGKEKSETKSMEELYNEQGIPVNVMKVQYRTFQKSHNYFGILRGIKESQKNSNVADRVQKIHVKVGDFVKENQVVLQFPLDNPTLQYSQAKAALENSEKLYQRTKALFEAGETSQANFEAIETQYIVNKRNYESIKQFLFVEAPISGRVTEIFVKEGDPVDFGNPLFTVAETNKLRSQIWVTEKEINELKPNMKANITWNERKFEGFISEISLMMDYKMRAFSVYVQIPNPNNVLKPGLTVDINIPTYFNPKAIVIPRNYVLKEDGRTFVYVNDNGIARKRDVTIGKENDLEYEIISGLKENDMVITTGLNMLDDGKKIYIAK